MKELKFMIISLCVLISMPIVSGEYGGAHKLHNKVKPVTSNEIMDIEIELFKLRIQEYNLYGY